MRSGLYLVPLALACSACSDPNVMPRLQPHPNVQTLEPGAYRLSFAAPWEGSAPNSTRWQDSRFLGSPLEMMSRPAIIFKADDFGTAIPASRARFIEMVDAIGGVSSLGMITSRIPEDERVRQGYRDLAAQGLELWFHGHRHDWSLPEAEFAGVSLDQQVAALEIGLETGRRRLGVEFYTFGAPGNEVDHNTPTALARFPELVVWLYKPTTGDALVIPRLIDFEQRTDQVMEPKDFFARLAALGEPEVIALQAHAKDWKSEADFVRFSEILERLTALDKYRYTTPYDYWRWRQDAASVSIEKESPTSYRLDLSAARYEQRIVFNPRRELPTVTVVAPR